MGTKPRRTIAISEIIAHAAADFVRPQVDRPTAYYPPSRACPRHGGLQLNTKPETIAGGGSGLRQLALTWAIRLSPWTLPLVLFLALLSLVGFWGVNIADGGLIPALSLRILNGEVPHVDFITPMPVGASVLHILDYALPVPLVLATKIVATAEFVAYGLLFSLFVYRKRLEDLSLAESLGVVVAVLVGLHQFPVISFYSIDGLLLLAGAYVLVQRGLASLSLRHVGLAFMLLGIATTTKQSFWPAPFLVFAWLIVDLVGRRVARDWVTRAAAVSIVSCAAAPTAYVLWVTLAGGFGVMWMELTQTTRVYGQPLIEQFQYSDARAALLPSLLVVAACAALVEAMRLLSRSAAVLDLGSRVVASAVLLRLTVKEDLAFNGSWSQRVFWCAAAVVVLRSLARRRPDVVGLMIIATAWMVTLSYGAPTPALAGGACVVYLANAFWRDAPRVAGRVAPAALTLGAVAGTALVVAYSVDARTHSDYGTLRSTEVWTLGGGAADVQMDAATHTYLADAGRCLRTRSARWKAVVPEGALADALYRVRNPFPIDWFWPPSYEVGTGRQRLIDSAARIDARGDYLLLFQTNAFPGANIPGKIQSFIHDPDLGTEIVARFTHAQKFQCGEFIAFYSPPR